MADRPHSQEVRFSEPTQSGHYGRNGQMQAHGITIEVWGGECHLAGLVSGERRSGAARLSVPFASLPALIAALQKVL